MVDELSDHYFLGIRGLVLENNEETKQARENDFISVPLNGHYFLCFIPLGPKICIFLQNVTLDFLNLIHITINTVFFQ